MNALEDHGLATLRLRQRGERNPPALLPLAGSLGQAPEVQHLDDDDPAVADRGQHLPDRLLDGRQVRGQGQRVAHADGGPKRLGRGDRLVEPPHHPAQPLGLAEVGRRPVDHGGAQIGPLDLEPPGVEHGGVPARPAGHVDHAPHPQLLEQLPIERPLVGQPLRPVDHRLVNVRQVFEHGLHFRPARPAGFKPRRSTLAGGVFSRLAAESYARSGALAVAIGMKRSRLGMTCGNRNLFTIKHLPISTAEPAGCRPLTADAADQC